MRRTDVVVRPRCSRPGHEDARVWVYGSRGPAGHKRPRWKCVPRNGDAPHEFSETLPRQTTHTGYCVECERDFGHHEGPQSARLYSFTVREVAAGLVRVGQGASYRDAAFAVRARAERWPARPTGGVRRTTHGQLIADWVEVFAPVVYEPYHDFDWPSAGSLLLDELPFRLNTGVPGGASSFSILAAMGWDERTRTMRLWRLEAHADGTSRRRDLQWRSFLQHRLRSTTARRLRPRP